MNLDLVKYFLPEHILDSFDIVDDKIHNDRVHFYLEEKNILPDKYQCDLEIIIKLMVIFFNITRKIILVILKIGHKKNMKNICFS